MRWPSRILDRSATGSSKLETNTLCRFLGSSYVVSCRMGNIVDPVAYLDGIVSDTDLTQLRCQRPLSNCKVGWDRVLTDKPMINVSHCPGE